MVRLQHRNGNREAGVMTSGHETCDGHCESTASPALLNNKANEENEDGRINADDHIALEHH